MREELRGKLRLMAVCLIHAAGLNLPECSLRTKDGDSTRNELTVRVGKEHEDSVTMVPETLAGPAAQAAPPILPTA